MKRTQHTTALLLQFDDQNTYDNDDNDDNSNPLLYNDFSRIQDTIVTEFSNFLIKNNYVHLDTRLREVAKGARQGFDKSTSIDDAVRERRRMQLHNEDPLLETDDDVWNRATTWLHEVMNDVIEQERTKSKGNNGNTLSSAGNEWMSDGKRIYPILAVGHSATFRMFLTRFVGMDKLLAHPNAKFDEKNRFQIPNTSLTILDITLTIPRRDFDEDEWDTMLLPSLNDYCEDRGIHINSSTDKLKLTVDIVELTSTRHCT